MSDFRMPSLGAEMESGRLVEWRVKPGDRVNRGDIVAVVDTDKAAVEVEIWESGVVGEIRVKPGERVPVGTVLATLIGVEEKAARPVSAGPEKTPVETTGRMRSVIAAAMARSKREIPHFYLSANMDVGVALDWLKSRNASVPLTERILFPVLLIKAVSRALAKVPELNGFWIDGNFKPSELIHLGIVISLRGGLVAPALHDVNRKSLSELMNELSDLVTRARAGTLKSSEIADATLTVTNLGDQGVDAVFGVIYPPQVALVGFGRTQRLPWVVGDEVLPRSILKATLSVDHRVTDGHRGSLFLSELGRLLQEPGSL